MEELRLLSDLLKTAGVPGAVLMLAVWLLVKYVAVPLTRGHLALIDALKTTLAKMATSAVDNNALQQQQVALMRSQDESTKQLAAGVRSLACQQAVQQAAQQIVQQTQHAAPAPNDPARTP